MNITIINDCRDANAAGRQIARVGSLLNSPVSFVGVTNDIQAAGNIIDILDAIEKNSGIILVNVAPRNGKAKNGLMEHHLVIFGTKKFLYSQV